MAEIKKVKVTKKMDLPQKKIKHSIDAKKKEIVTEKLDILKEAKRNEDKAIETLQKKEEKKYPEVSQIIVEQYRSSIRKPERQCQQLKSLGLGRIGKTKILPNIPTISKLVERLKHLVRVK